MVALRWMSASDRKRTRPYRLPLAGSGNRPVPAKESAEMRVASRASAEIVARLPDGERTEQVEAEARRDADDPDECRAWFGALLRFADQEVTP